MEFLFTVPPDFIRNAMSTTFYPFLYVLTEAGPKETKSHSIKGFRFTCMASIWSCIEVSEYFLSQIYRNCDQSDKYIVRKDRFV